jgi:hypothetical protein
MFFLKGPAKRKDLQEILKKFSYPTSINRISFDLSHIKKWKATEYRVFFLYLALPLLKGMLPSKHYWNLCALIYGIHFLC